MNNADIPQGEGASYDDGAKAFKAKQQHTPSLIQQIQKEALKVQNDALKGIGSLKNKVFIKHPSLFLAAG